MNKLEQKNIDVLQRVIDAATKMGVFSEARAVALAQQSLDSLQVDIENMLKEIEALKLVVNSRKDVPDECRPA